MKEQIFAARDAEMHALLNGKTVYQIAAEKDLGEANVDIIFNPKNESYALKLVLDGTDVFIPVSRALTLQIDDESGLTLDELMECEFRVSHAVVYKNDDNRKKVKTEKVAAFIYVEFPAKQFQDIYPAKHRTQDGHYVRSRAEILIDNFLYQNSLVHAYERKIPVTEAIYCDFYLPNGKVYIEYWGLENDVKYNERKYIKQELYKKYGLKLIELNDTDILNLDEVLSKKLLQLGIKVY